MTAILQQGGTGFNKTPIGSSFQTRLWQVGLYVTEVDGNREKIEAATNLQRLFGGCICYFLCRSAGVYEWGMV